MTPLIELQVMILSYDMIIILNILLVLDEFKERVPVVFCLSNWGNFAFKKLYLSKIRDNTVAISPCWFLNDTASQFYEAFALVNECSPKQFTVFDMLTTHAKKNFVVK